MTNTKFVERVKEIVARYELAIDPQPITDEEARQLS